jgi:hypothetical protein
MTQLLAIAIAAFFLGIGMAGEPLEPLRALICGVVLVVVALAASSIRARQWATFLFAFFGVLATCYVQHAAIYPGTGVVALGLGLLATSSFGRRTAPAAIAGFGSVLGLGLFFLNTTF